MNLLKIKHQGNITELQGRIKFIHINMYTDFKIKGSINKTYSPLFNYFRDIILTGESLFIPELLQQKFTRRLKMSTPSREK